MSDNKGLVWVLVGCGALALLGLCGGGGVFAWLFYVAQEEVNQQIAITEEAIATQEHEMRALEEMRAQEPQAVTPTDLSAILNLPPPLVTNPRRTSDRARRRVQALVTVAMGNSGVTVGQQCNFDVQVLARSGNRVGYWCRALVECNGVRLYGQDRPDGSGNGYFDCELFDSPLGVAGEDRTPSGPEERGDPFFQIDTRQSRFVVLDDNASEMRPNAYRVEATITSVN